MFSEFDFWICEWFLDYFCLLNKVEGNDHFIENWSRNDRFLNFRKFFIFRNFVLMKNRVQGDQSSSFRDPGSSLGGAPARICWTSRTKSFNSSATSFIFSSGDLNLFFHHMCHISKIINNCAIFSNFPLLCRIQYCNCFLCYNTM